MSKIEPCKTYRPNTDGVLVLVECASTKRSVARREKFGVWHDNSQSWDAGPMSLTDAAEYAARCGDEVMFYGAGSPTPLNKIERRIVRDMLIEGSE